MRGSGRHALQDQEPSLDCWAWRLDGRRQIAQGEGPSAPPRWVAAQWDERHSHWPTQASLKGLMARESAWRILFLSSDLDVWGVAPSWTRRGFTLSDTWPKSLWYSFMEFFHWVSSPQIMSLISCSQSTSNWDISFARARSHSGMRSLSLA